MSPPDITMYVGERRNILTNGLNPLDMPPAASEVRSDDPSIVSVEGPDKNNAYLKANSVGSTRVYYNFPPDHPTLVNRGFEVTVLSMPRH